MIQQQQQQETLIWNQNHQYIDKLHDSLLMDQQEKYPIWNVKQQEQETEIDSAIDSIIHQQKRTSWCLDSHCADTTINSNGDNEEQLRQELIQRATTRLRRRLLEQGLQDVMNQVVSLQTQLETLRLDAATTIDTISDIFSVSDDDEGKTTTSSLEATLKMNRQMDVLERRLDAHKSSLVQLTTQQEVSNNITAAIKPTTAPAMKEEETSSSPLTALSMSRLSSLSLMSSIFGRGSSASSCASSTSSAATSISDSCCNNIKYDQLLDDDCISQIEHIQGRREEDCHPFYDLAGKRSFREGSFCGSVYYHQVEQQKEAAPIILTHSYVAPNTKGNANAEIRHRRRQRRQRHQQHLEQRQQQYYSSDNESIVSDDLSTFSSISSSISNLCSSPSYHYHGHNTFMNEMFCHPLSSSSVTPSPPHHLSSYDFHHHYQEDLTHSWISNNHDLLWSQEATKNSSNALFDPTVQRNVLDDLMSFLDGSTGDDGGFKEDALFLLERPDLCRRPLSEVQTTLQQHRLSLLQEQQQFEQDAQAAEEAKAARAAELKQRLFTKEHLIKFLNPVTLYRLGLSFSTDMIYKTTCSSLEWCRFLSVLAAAVVISLLKGPEDIRRASF